MDNEIYNYPLSAYVKIPDSWNYVRTEQNGIVDTLITTMSDSCNLVLVNVIPDNGVLKLSPVTSTTVEDEILNVSGFKLYQNYPNPFNPSTQISYQLPLSGEVKIKIYDVLGNEVTTLVDEYKLAGRYNVQFTINEEQLSSGLYFYQIRFGKFSDTKKMLFLK